MKNDLNQLKKVTNDLINGNNSIIQKENKNLEEELNTNSIFQK